MNLHQPEQQAPKQRRTLRVLQGCSMRVKIWRCLPFGPKRKAKNRLSPVYYVLALGRIALGRYQEEVQVLVHPLFQLSSFGILRIMIQKLFFQGVACLSTWRHIFFIRTRIGKKLLRSRIVSLGLSRICCQGPSIKDVSSDSLSPLFSLNGIA